ALEDEADVAQALIAAHGLETVVELAILLHRVLELFAVALGHSMLEVPEPFLHLQDGREGVFGLLVDGPAVLDHLFLAEISEADTSRVLNAPLVRLHLAREDAEQRRLAAAVPA